MPLQNRVLPTGDIVADPARGLFTGNRGILPFDADGRMGARRWTHPHWIICTLTHPRGRYHGPRPAGRWTPLFFLDEAVALAAGHRPCAYCRPRAYAAFKSAWATAHGPANHEQIDRSLHAARVTRARAQIRYQADASTLPCGTFILHDAKPALIKNDGIHYYRPEGYVPNRMHTDGIVTVLTPRPAVAVLAAGYRPQLHITAG